MRVAEATEARVGRAVTQAEHLIGRGRLGGCVAQEGQDRVTVALGILLALEDHHHGGVARRAARTVTDGREGRLVHELDTQIHRSDQRGVGLARLQAAAGQLERAQARQLLRRDGQAGPAEIELLAQTVGDDVRHRADDARRSEQRHEAVAGLSRPARRRAERLGPARDSPACAVPRDLCVALHADVRRRALVRQRDAVHGLQRRCQEQQLLRQGLLQIPGRKAQP